MTDHSFTPDWVSPPGETIIDLINDRGWSQSELAKRLGCTAKHVSQMVNGKVSITDDMALKLERVVGGTAAFWLNREAQYREAIARCEEAERFKEWVPWLDGLPVKELMAAGAIPKQRIDASRKPGIVRDLLSFFGMATPEEWQDYYQALQPAYRRTREEQSDSGAIGAWLRLGEIQAEGKDLPRYDRGRFEKALHEARALTREPKEVIFERLSELCHGAGVNLVVVPAIPRAHVSGVARWLSGQRPLLQLSLYGKTNDRFWFTFFHEAAHILLHEKDRKGVFLDETTGKAIKSVQEDEANTWASEFLIPPGLATGLRWVRSRKDVMEFADQVGLHPGIIVGRLQHEDARLYNSPLNKLKVSMGGEAQNEES